MKVKAGGQEPLRLRVRPLLRSQGRATLAPQQLLLRSWRIAPNAGRVSGRSGGTAAYLKFHALRDNLNGRRRASRNPGQESPSDILILLAGRMWDTPRRRPLERRKSRHKRPRSSTTLSGNSRTDRTSATPGRAVPEQQHAVAGLPGLRRSAPHPSAGLCPLRQAERALDVPVHGPLTRLRVVVGRVGPRKWGDDHEPHTASELYCVGWEGRTTAGSRQAPTAGTAHANLGAADDR